MERPVLTETQRQQALRQFYSPSGDTWIDLEIIQPLLDLERQYPDELHLVRCPVCDSHHLVEKSERHLVPHDVNQDEEARYRVTCQLLNEPFEIVSY